MEYGDNMRCLSLFTFGTMEEEQIEVNDVNDVNDRTRVWQFGVNWRDQVSKRVTYLTYVP